MITSALFGALPPGFRVALIAHAHRRVEHELRFLPRKQVCRGTALDVGAWYGPWSYWLARCFARVHAFEPNPDLARSLTRGLPSNVSVHPVAASDQSGTAQLTVPLGGRGTEGRARLGHLDDGGRPVTVETRRLDDFGFEDVRVVKIDVEGHELDVLRGAQDLLARWRPMLVVELEYRYADVDASLDLLRSFGYRGWVLVDGSWRSLDDVDLEAAQRRPPSAGYLRQALGLAGNVGYVNNVVFKM